MKIVLALALAASLAAQPLRDDIRMGMPLVDALGRLQRRGVKLVFSTRVVRPSMRVTVEPHSDEPRELLAELLAPHGLRVADGPGGTFVVVAEAAGPAPARGAVPAAPPPVARFEERIAVQPSRISLLVDEPPGTVSLTREEIEALPHLGDDVVRTLQVLPGTTLSNELSAQVHVRGGRRDELMILLDGQELYDAFHLKDFDNALSIVSASTLASVDFLTAAFPVSYGDRMAGVLNMTTLAPPETRHLRAGVSLLGADIQAGASRDRLGWIASARRGSTDLLGRAFGHEDPSFWDLFGKADLQINKRHGVQLRALVSRDALAFVDEEAGKELRTEYDSAYVWATHRAALGAKYFADTTLSLSLLERDRNGHEADEERSYDVHDQRDVEVIGLVQSWHVQATPRNFVIFGGELQTWDAHYDYFSTRHFATPLGHLRAEPREGVFAFKDDIRRNDLGLYASDRFRPHETFVIDAGVRFDHRARISDDDDRFSPRVSGAWTFAPSSVLRFAWGRFSQSQRVYELMVEDGDTTVYPTERSTHSVLALEHRFSPRVPLTSIRAEVYRREVENPRPRYEHLFEPFDPFPEGEYDRVRIEPESARAEGVELLFRGRPGRRFDWWLNYAISSTKERIDGRDVPRRIDQRHVVNLDVNYRHAKGWNLNLAFLYRTGWRFTPVHLETVDDELVPVAGDINSGTLPSYQRVDLRWSREWAIRRGTLRFYVEAHNLFNRANVLGLDVTFAEDYTLQTDHEFTPRFFGTAGVVWELR